MSKKKSGGRRDSVRDSGNTPSRSGDINISDSDVSGDVVGQKKNVITNTSSVTIGLPTGKLTDLAQLFAAINQKIDKQPVAADVKDELKENVKKIEEEVKKGDQADPGKVERWLKFIATMSGDIFQVTAATLTNPVAGVATAIRLIAQKAQQPATQ